MIALYPRVSTGNQVEGTSLETQIELCMKKLKELNLDTSRVKIYREEGQTGEDIDRKAMNELRSDVVSGLITHVICTHPDRLSRDMTDKLIVCREFEKHGVELIFVDTEYKNTPEGQLFFNMQSAIAQYELALIKKRTTRGRIKKVEKDNKIMPMRVAPFGYDLVNSTLVINKEEAQFVKMVYEWYVYERISIREIGERLYKLGISPKRGESKNWNKSSILRILTSEVYIGKFYYNKKKSNKVKGQKTKGGNPKRTYEFRNKEEWIELSVPSIIDLGLFNLAQEQKTKNMKNMGGNVKHEYLLKSMLRCGHCGLMWAATYSKGRNNVKYHLYRCRGKAPVKYGDGIDKCCAKSIRSDLLDDYVWGVIRDIILDPEVLIQELQNKSTISISSINNTLTILNNKINEKNKEKEKVKTMFKREVINEEEMVDDLSKINKSIKELELEIAKYQNQVDDFNKENQTVERMNDIINILKQRVTEDKEFTFQEKRTILEVLVDEIIIEMNGDYADLTYIGILNSLKKEKALKLNTSSSLQYQDDINSNECNFYLTYQSNLQLK